MSRAKCILEKFGEAKSSDIDLELKRKIDGLDADLIPVKNKKYILLWFDADSKWVVYTNEPSKFKHIPGQPIMEISAIDAKQSAVEDLVKKMLK